MFDCHLEVIEDASHMVMMEAPDRVNQFIHAFIITSTSSSLVGPFKNSSSVTNTNTNTNTGPHQDGNPDLMQRSKSRQSQRSLKSGKGLRRSHTQNLLRTGFKKWDFHVLTLLFWKCVIKLNKKYELSNSYFLRLILPTTQMTKGILCERSNFL